MKPAEARLLATMREQAADLRRIATSIAPPATRKGA